MKLTKKQVEALRALILYTYNDEEEDFRATRELHEDTSAHVFRAIRRLDRALADHTRANLHKGCDPQVCDSA